MKKVLFISALVLLTIVVSSQIVIQGTIVHSGATNATVYSKPNTAFTKLFSNVNISVSIVDQGVNNPIVSIANNFIPNLAFSTLYTFPNPQIVAGRAYYTFIGNDNGSATTTSWTTGNNPIIELAFSNSNGFSTLQLNDVSPIGGPSRQMFFYVEVKGEGDITNNGIMMYGNGAVNTSNRASASFVPLQPVDSLPGQANKNVYDLLRSVDDDGEEKKLIRGVSIHPNPAKTGFYVSVPLLNSNGSMVKLNLLNHLGQVVHSREISSAQANNYYYDVKSPGLITGVYMLQIVHNNEVLGTKKIIIAR